MQELSNKRQPKKSPERSQRPLWAVIIGLAISLYSYGIKDENIGDVVFMLGVICSIVGVLYWVFQPKHGLK